MWVCIQDNFRELKIDTRLVESQNENLANSRRS